MEREQGLEGGSELLLKGRALLRLSGAEEVLRFDESCVLIKTLSGIMSVEGEELKLLSLEPDRSTVSISGRIDGMLFSPEQKGKRKRGQSF